MKKNAKQLKEKNTPQVRKKLTQREELSAGGVVYKWKNGRIKIGFILDPYKKWIFAKGHVEPGETIKRAAVRETKEEMGLKSIRLESSLGSIDFSFTRKPYRIHKVVHYFLMRTQPHEKGKPQKKEKIRAIRWVGMRTAQKILGYDNTRVILHRAIAKLKKKKPPQDSALSSDT